MISSPACHSRARARLTWNVSVVMFAPKATSSGDAFEKISQRTARVGDGGVRLLTRGIGPVRVRVVMEEVVSHPVGDDGRDLGAAWSVEVRHGMAAVLPAERGKLIADDVYWRDVRHSGSNRLSQRTEILASSVGTAADLSQRRYPDSMERLSDRHHYPTGSSPSSAIEISRIRYFWILPVTVIGNSAVNRT